MGKSKMRRWLWLLSLVLILAAFGYFLLAGWNGDIRRGNELVLRVKGFRQRQGRLPESFKEVGVTNAEEDKFFYEKCDGRRFIIWFGTSLGESMTYDSSSDTWRPFNTSCNAAVSPGEN